MAIKRGTLTVEDIRAVGTGRRLAPVHPGEVLMHDFIEAMGLTRYRVAQAAGIAPTRLNEICAGERAVSADTVLRLGRVFDVSPQFWMNLQVQFDLEMAQRALGAQLMQETVRLSV